jgi:hypothetical protein
MLQRIVWAGANLSSFSQASTALKVLAGIDLSPKQVRRMTQQVGQDRLAERQQQVATFQERPLMERITSPVNAPSVELGVVQLDGGRYQRRDHFGDEEYQGSHWKEDKIGLVLHMTSEVHDRDPHPEFPEWLANADVVREIAALGTLDPEKCGVSEPLANLSAPEADPPHKTSGWCEFAPELISREVIASSECGEDFGHHLEHTAWQLGVVDAPRMAFVADGASVNWTIHRTHFSQMTGILDLMHALSYAWKAAKTWNDHADYTRWATAIWQGRVEEVITELQTRLEAEPVTAEHRAEEPVDAVQRAVTYYRHHCSRMDYPRYRQQGLPLTSSHIESTIKQINLRLKGSEKFFRKDSGETLLQLRADSLSDSQPLQTFWPRWLSRQSGANSYRKQSA